MDKLINKKFNGVKPELNTDKAFKKSFLIYYDYIKTLIQIRTIILYKILYLMFLGLIIVLKAVISKTGKYLR